MKQETQNTLDESDPSLFSDDWFPAPEEYTPGFTKDQWLNLLNSKKIIGPVWGGVLAAFYDAGGASTCAQIAQRYNKSPSAIIGNRTQLAKRIYKETQCPLSIRDDGKNRYWPILFQGKNAGSDVVGGFGWLTLENAILWPEHILFPVIPDPLLFDLKEFCHIFRLHSSTSFKVSGAGYTAGTISPSRAFFKKSENILIHFVSDVKESDPFDLFSGLFRSRDKPVNRTAGSSYAFYLGGSSSGKIVTERSAMQMTAIYRKADSSSCFL